MVFLIALVVMVAATIIVDRVCGCIETLNQYEDPE